MEEVGTAAVGVRRVGMTVGFQPSLSQQLTSRPLTMSFVGWGLWVAVLLVRTRMRMKMSVIHQDMEGQVFPDTIR